MPSTVDVSFGFGGLGRNSKCGQVLLVCVGAVLLSPALLGLGLTQMNMRCLHTDRNGVPSQLTEKHLASFVGVYVAAAMIAAIVGYCVATDGMEVEHHYHVHITTDDTWTTRDDDAYDPSTGITYHNLGQKAAASYAFFYGTYAVTLLTAGVNAVYLCKAGMSCLTETKSSFFGRGSNRQSLLAEAEKRAALVAEA